MSVAVLKLENETLIAFNLNMISRMNYDEKGITFVHDGNVYATYFLEGARILHLHSSVCSQDGVMLYSAEAMFEKFCNL